MRVLVVGGSGSGKSAYAEKLACSLSDKRTYVATMLPQGAEAQERIEKHRRQRAGRGFTTVECAESLPAHAPSNALSQGVVLLDDLGNLMANALFDDDGTMGDVSAICDLLERQILVLTSSFHHAVVVGNEVGCEGLPAYDSTLAWLRAMGTLCNRVAAAFDAVVEVTCGIPHTIKGDLA